jgi:hypothetical protein
MRHALTQDFKLNQLGINLDYWRDKYEHSHRFFKSEYYEKYQEARKEFGEYYRAKYPTTMPIQKSKDYVMLADQTEKFENFEN